MVVNQKVTGKAWSIPGGIAFAEGMGIISTLLGAAVSATLLMKEILRWEHIGRAAMLIVFSSSLIITSIATGKTKRRKLMVVLLSAGIYYAILLAIGILILRGEISGAITQGALILGAAGIVLFVGTKGENRKKFRKYKNRIR